MANKTKVELEKEIVILQLANKEMEGTMDKHGLLPKPMTLQDQIVGMESGAMEEIQKIAQEVVESTGRPFITIRGRVISYEPTIVLDSEVHVSVIKNMDSLKDMIDYMVAYRFSNPSRYDKFDKNGFKTWVARQIENAWDKYS